jgi:hypothetical protein
MHPHPSHTGLVALMHDLLGDFRSRSDHHAIDAARDRLQVGVAGTAVERLHVRIYRENIVPGLLQSSTDQIADRVVAVVA